MILPLENIRRFINFGSLFLFLHLYGFGRVVYYFLKEMQSTSPILFFTEIHKDFFIFFFPLRADSRKSLFSVVNNTKLALL